MASHPTLLLLALLQVCGCFWLGHREETPSAIGVNVLLRSAATGPELEVGFSSAEGDWSYRAFPDARVDGLKITADSGATIQPVSQRCTPDPHEGGHVVLTLPPLDASVRILHVEGRLQASEEGGQRELVTDIAQDVVVPGRAGAQ